LGNGQRTQPSIGCRIIYLPDSQRGENERKADFT
jgi:hypothetical protein